MVQRFLSYSSVIPTPTETAKNDITHYSSFRNKTSRWGNCLWSSDHNYTSLRDATSQRRSTQKCQTNHPRQKIHVINWGLGLTPVFNVHTNFPINRNNSGYTTSDSILQKTLKNQHLCKRQLHPHRQRVDNTSISAPTTNYPVMWSDPKCCLEHYEFQDHILVQWPNSVKETKPVMLEYSSACIHSHIR